MLPNPYAQFWDSLKATIANSDLTKLGISRFVEAELDPKGDGTYRKLCGWCDRDFPVQSIAFLIAILEVMGYELAIKKK